MVFNWDNSIDHPAFVLQTLLITKLCKEILQGWLNQIINGCGITAATSPMALIFKKSTTSETGIKMCPWALPLPRSGCPLPKLCSSGPRSKWRQILCFYLSVGPGPNWCEQFHRTKIIINKNISFNIKIQDNFANK